MHKYLAVQGPIIHSLGIKQLEIIPKAILLADQHSGKILQVVKEEVNVNHVLEKYRIQKSQCELFPLKEGQFLMSGFVDVHTHAPQYMNCGIGIDKPLLEWLEAYTFDTESRCSDLNFATELYEKCVSKHLRNGTTTCVYYGTIHKDATLLLADICIKKQQRSFVGKVNMNQHSPPNYVEHTIDSINSTKEFIDMLLKNQENNKTPLVNPILTPRFIPTSSPALLRELGKLLKIYPKLLVQSHLSENWSEVQWVKQLHPQIEHYLQVYDEYGLLPQNQSIMAHAIHLSDKEIHLLKRKNVLVAHCPLSNFTLNSGILDVRRLLQENIMVGLGTDCSAGYAPSMLNAIRSTLIASQANSIHHRDSIQVEEQLAEVLQSKEMNFHATDSMLLSLEEIFYMATLGGAKGLQLGNITGNFEQGKEFDALVVDLDVENSPIDSFRSLMRYKNETERLKLDWQRFLLLGDDRNICHRFVQGRKID